MTDVQICNLALARLGDARLPSTITSVTDPNIGSTAQGTYCAMFYAQTLQELETDLDWQFCRTLATVTADAAPPAFGYAGRYALPSGLLRILRINGIDISENFGKWEVIGGFIHTSLTGPISLDYIASVTTTTLFPPVFIELFTAKLAAALALPLTGSKELYGQMVSVFVESLKKPSVRSLVISQAKDRAAAAMSADEICRQAILRVGTADSMGPATQSMLLAQSLLPQVRDSLLLAGSWTWANKSATLTSDTLAPEFKWAARYALPADCLRIFKVNDVDYITSDADWEIQGGYLLTDETSDAPDWVTGRVYAVGNAVTQSGTVYRCLVANTAGTFATDLAANKWVAWTGSVLAVEYISRVTDPTVFDPMFVELLSATLAAKLAVPLVGDPNMAKLLTAEAESLLKTSAMRRDSTKRKAGIQPAWTNSKLVAARHA